MEISERKELRELTIKTYIAKDGATFDNYDACYRHESTLMKNEMQDYIDTKCIEQWCDCWGELPGFLNLGGNTMYLVVIDERIVLSTNDWTCDEWYFEGTVHQVIDDLQQSITWLSIIAGETKNTPMR